MRNLKRTFIIGEEWLYYKIYCGSYSADTILVETISPVIFELQKRKLVDYWFFIRYNDPKNHLRLRLHLNKVEEIQEVIQIMTSYLSKLIKEETAYEINVGTYRREMERYGGNTIIEAEKMFYYHSQKTLKILSETLLENDEIVRIFAALKDIDDLLDYFKISLLERQDFAKEKCVYFRLEQDINRHNTKKMADLYSKYKSDIFLLLQHKKEPEYLEGLFEILNSSDEEMENIKIICKKIKKNKKIDSLTLISSIIHMNVNRIFRSKQRQYEMLCFDFMNKYYKTLMKTNEK
ncbi:thiopeptide-type bacteriocin biosynthesis domain-containing protein [Flavobacterium sp. ov086]|nr:thiopeptide-type bacteriocin biosynthesis domain-containing protein [Flavobacterium sp. ov086]